MAIDKAAAIAAARYVARLLCALNLGTDKPEKPDSVSYRQVFTLAKRHSVAGALFYVLEDEVRESGDAELIARFERERDLDFAKQLVQTREFAAVTESLSAAGIDFLPLKGFMMKALWRRPEYRTMTDMDIYVSRSGIDAAAGVLESLGYTAEGGDGVHDSYLKPPYVNIELHKTLGNYGDGDFSLWKCKPDMPHWYVMSDEDTLVFMLDHMYKHYKAGGTGMRSFFDLYLYLEAKGERLDREYVDRELEERGMKEFYEDALALVGLWFCGAADNGSLAELELFIVTGGTFGNVENKVKYALKKKSRFRYALSRIFLTYPQMKHLYKWLGPLPFLLPVAWVMRLFGALFDGRLRREVRAVGAASAKESAEDQTAPTKKG